MSKIKNLRTDIISKNKFDKYNLNRIVYVKKDKKLYWDNNHIYQGRSFYFSFDQNLVQKMLNRQILYKVLKSKQMYDEESYSEIINLILQQKEKNDQRQKS